MSDEPTGRLTRDEVLALKAAARRQLARWTNKRELSPHQHKQRTALTRAVRILQDKTFTNGCQLHGVTREESADV